MNPTSTMNAKNPGEAIEARRELAARLAGLLADTYTLYNTTQNFHWNVESRRFKSRHDLYEEQYTEMAEAIDTIAERIRILGFYTPGRLEQIRELTRIDQPAENPTDEQMVEYLVRFHGVVVERIRDAMASAKDQDDEGTLDLLVARVRSHEKMRWMLKSHTDEGSEKLADLEPARVRAGD